MIKFQKSEQNDIALKKDDEGLINKMQELDPNMTDD